jgi:hypothetical protein
MPRSLLALLCLPVLAAPASASAAVRYADPSVQSDSPAPCTQASPCGIVKAVNQASRGDEVVLKPGEYQLTLSGVTLEPPAGRVVVHGDFNAPRPRIVSDSDQVLFMHRNSTAAWLEIQDNADGAEGLVIDQTSAATQVVSRVGGKAATACTVLGFINNSVCHATGAGPKTYAVQSRLTRGLSATPTLRNVTAVATQPTGTAVVVDATTDTKAGGTPQASSVQLSAVNVIASGGTPGQGGYDVLAHADPSATAKATFDYSNYNTVQLAGSGASATPVGTAHNQKALPTFADLAGGDLHENPCSPTVGAGVIDTKTGPVDADRQPRTLDGKIDIGGYENNLSCAGAAPTAPGPTAPQ